MTRKTTLTVALALSVAACAGDTTNTTDAPSTTAVASTTTVTTPTPAAAPPTTLGAPGFPVTIEYAGMATTIEERPGAIVSLSPTATEMLFAIGAGDQVVAVDEFSYYPPEAPVTDLSGFTPNLEAIIAYDPDLVVVQGDQDGIVEALGGVGVPVLVLTAAVVLDDVFDQIDALGSATGQSGEASSLVEAMRTEIDDFLASVEPADEPLTYYHELGSDGGGSFYSVTSETFIGEVFGAFGLENIADPADTDGFGYPLVSGEFVLDADPDLVFYTNCCGDTPETIGGRAGWSDLTAVGSGHLYELDDDLASRWGPRIVDFFGLVAGAVAEATG